MNDLRIEGTQSTPLILCDGQGGTLSMHGDSYPENSFELFAPVLAWTEQFLRDAAAALSVNLHLLYLNTSSVRVMMDLFDMLEEAHRKGRQVAVYWYYDQQNERVAELAEEFKEDCSFPFAIVPRAE